MADGRSSFDIATDPSYRIEVAGKPLTLVSPVGIHEPGAAVPETEDETGWLDDEPDDEA